MTIYVDHGNKMFDPAVTPRLDSGVYDLSGEAAVDYKFDWCFAGFWTTSTRQKPGYIRLLANRRIDGRWSANEAHVTSLVSYAEWISSVFHTPCYVVKTKADLDIMVKDDREHGEANGRLKDKNYDHKVKHDNQDAYALELRWDAGHKADQLFTAISYTRFACYEYTSFAAPGLDDFTPKSLLVSVFSGGFILKMLHMPFIDYSNLFDGFGGKDKPQINAEFGAALYDFAVAQLRNREWRNTSAIDADASHYSYVKCAEFHTFYRLWKNDGINMAEFQAAHEKHLAARAAVAVEPLDEKEERYYNGDDYDDDDWQDEDDEDDDDVDDAVDDEWLVQKAAPAADPPVKKPVAVEHERLMKARLAQGMVLFPNPRAVKLADDLRIRFNDEVAD